MLKEGLMIWLVELVYFFRIKDPVFFFLHAFEARVAIVLLSSPRLEI